MSDQTVGNILKEHGVEPAPDRKQQATWKTFIKAHFNVLAAIDFTSVEVWTKGGLVTFYLLFVLELKTRRVCFAGCTPNPDERWIKQIVRNLTDCEDGFPNDKRYLIMDRDTKFCESFRSILEQSDVEPVILPPRSPNLKGYASCCTSSVRLGVMAAIRSRSFSLTPGCFIGRSVPGRSYKHSFLSL